MLAYQVWQQGKKAAPKVPPKISTVATKFVAAADLGSVDSGYDTAALIRDQQKMAEAEQARQQQTLEAERALRESRAMLIQDADAREIELLAMRQEQELAMVAGNEQAIAALREAHRNQQAAAEQKMTEIHKQQALAQASATLGSIAAMARGQHEYIALYKTAAIAQTIIDTYSSAQSAFKAMSGIPYVGPVLGAAAAAAAIAIGVANIAQISAAKFALGGEFVTSGPRTITVGDNPGGRERVTVTPLSSPNVNGPRDGGAVFNFYDNSGSLVETFRRQLRSGQADAMVSDLAQMLRGRV
jgi:hypothetical protein